MNHMLGWDVGLGPGTTTEDKTDQQPSERYTCGPAQLRAV